MKRKIAQVLLAGSLIAFIVAIIYAWPLIEFSILDDVPAQKKAAKKYMDSLTDKDLQAWIQRTQTILKEDHPNRFVARNASLGLERLGITGIEENSNEVDYVWLGGIDYTGLFVEQMSNGNFEAIAVYSPSSNRVIWPRQ
jgi:hypothetical protein